MKKIFPLLALAAILTAATASNAATLATATYEPGDSRNTTGPLTMADADGIISVSLDKINIDTVSGSATSTDLLKTFISPDTNVGAGGKWTCEFSMTTTSAIQLDTIDLAVCSFNSGGAGQGQERNGVVNMTLTLEHAGNTYTAKNLSQIDIGADSTGTTTLTFVDGLGNQLLNAPTLTAGSYILKLSAERTDSTQAGMFVGVKSLTLNGSAVPEPTTASLGLFALGGLLMRRRRK